MHGPTHAHLGLCRVRGKQALRWVPPSSSGAASNRTNETRIGGRILVADDNADMREYIVPLLLGQHWTVEAVADGVEALAAARRAPPDLLISGRDDAALGWFRAAARTPARSAKSAGTPTILLSARAGQKKPPRKACARARMTTCGEAIFGKRPVDPSGNSVVRGFGYARSLRAAAESERQRLETVFRESPAAICILRGPELIVELANPLILQVWGKSSAIIGLPFADAVPEIRWPRVPSISCMACAEQLAFQVRARKRLRGSTERVTAYCATPTPSTSFMRRSPRQTARSMPCSCAYASHRAGASASKLRSITRCRAARAQGQQRLPIA